MTSRPDVTLSYRPYVIADLCGCLYRFTNSAANHSGSDGATPLIAPIIEFFVTIGRSAPIATADLTTIDIDY
jgi:hypothetical protein